MFRASLMARPLPLMLHLPFYNLEVHLPGVAFDMITPCVGARWRLWREKCHDDSETKNWLTAHTKPCPKCGKPVEKNGGCNLVMCVCRQVRMRARRRDALSPVCTLTCLWQLWPGVPLSCTPHGYCCYCHLQFKGTGSDASSGKMKRACMDSDDRAAGRPLQTHVAQHGCGDMSAVDPEAP